MALSDDVVAILNDEHCRKMDFFIAGLQINGKGLSEVAKQIALEGMQMMGGYGYASEYDMERHVRGTLPGTIYGGTSEIQREIIGTTFGL